ncbi:hypothetical protein EDC01DRAFT_633420 [Geopyxis carbonaria]|nr:hypothetical protein EDC01DRAFT_633420 [Geopyxis carbonaria]
MIIKPAASQVTAYKAQAVSKVEPFRDTVPDPYKNTANRWDNRNQGMVPYSQVRRIWCDLHRTSTHDIADCREQHNGATPYQARRSSAPRPYYNARAPVAIDNNLIGTMVQQQVMQALSTMINVNGKRPAQKSHQPAGHARRGQPVTEHSSGHRYEMHCLYCGKDDHYIATCPSKRADEERSMMTQWRPQPVHGSTALAIMAGPSTDAQPQTVHYMPNSAPSMPNASPYVNTNARDIGPQPKLH